MEAEVTTRQRDAQKDVTDLVQIIGQTLNTALLYGVSHKVSQSFLEISYTVISTFIEFHHSIHFSIADGVLLINGESTEGSPLAAGLTNRLTSLNLFSFTIEPGFSKEESIALFSLLLTPTSKLNPEKSATDLMRELGLKHIEAKSFSYRLVSEDAPDAGVPAGAAISPAPAMAMQAPSSDQPDLDNIMAFLKDDGTGDTLRSAEDIRRLAGDAEKLAELVLRTIEIRATPANLAEGESLTDLIVGCIQKVVQPILKGPDSKTQKGRKQIKHSLLMLEKALLDQLQSLAGDQTAHAVENIMDEIVEDLDLDAIASKYMKNRRLAEKSNEKIAHLIERSSDDPGQLEELRERLIDQGLTPKGWQELTVKFSAPTAGAGTGEGHGPGTGDGANEIKVLTLLLARIGDAIQRPPSPGTSSEIHALVSEADLHLSSLAEKTNRKIDTLQSMLTDEKKSPTLSRQALLEILAEIAQEIMQPLTIITGTTAIIRSHRPGPLTEAQGELLSMMAESGERIILLVNHLMQLAGTPETLTPDHKILKAAYQ